MFAIACGVSLFAQNNAVPTLNQPLIPMVAAPGARGLTLTVNGTGFATGATVNCNGSPRSTQFVSSSQLTATLPSTDLMVAGTSSITVVNPGPGGGSSNPVPFAITWPVSTVSLVNLAMGYATQTGPQQIITADFNADGKPDLAVVNECITTVCDSPGSVSIYLGNGDGTFQAPVVFVSGTFSPSAGGSLPSSIAAADINGDGKLDLAITNTYCAQFEECQVTGTVAVLLGNGDGTFQPDVEFAVGYYPASIVVGDFNGDGALDIAVVELPGTPLQNSMVSVLLGNGDGTFQPQMQFAAPGYLKSIATSDFNGDGRLDLALSGGDAVSEAAVMLGNGDGTFQVQTNYPTGFIPLGIAAMDLNGDGKPDLAVLTECGSDSLCQGEGSVSVLLGNGDGTFQPAVEYSTGIDPVGMSVLDLTGNGNLGFVISTLCGTNPLCEGDPFSPSFTFLYGNGDGTFQPQVNFTLAGSPIGGLVATADFNGDGLPDIASVVDQAVFAFLQTTLNVSELTLTYGSQTVGGETGAQSSMLTNVGTVGNIKIANTRITGANPRDFILTQTCPGTLTPTQQCPVSAVFSPTAAGPRTATVAITDSAVGSPHMIALSGTGIASAIATLSTESLTFSSQIVNTVSETQTVTLTNTGSATLTISSVTGSAEFPERNGCGASLSPGSRCAISVAFKPRAGGLRSGSLTISDNAPGSPQTVALTGTGLFFELSASSLSFGTQTVGISAKPQTLTLTNLANIAGGLSAVRIVGANPSSFTQTNTCGPTVAGDGSCTITVIFTPKKTGSLAASVQVEAGGVQLTAALSGTGR
jgi:hypothetical protein